MINASAFFRVFVFEVLGFFTKLIASKRVMITYMGNMLIGLAMISDDASST